MSVMGMRVREFLRIYFRISVILSHFMLIAPMTIIYASAFMIIVLAEKGSNNILKIFHFDDR